MQPVNRPQAAHRAGSFVSPEKVDAAVQESRQRLELQKRLEEAAKPVDAEVVEPVKERELTPEEEAKANAAKAFEERKKQLQKDLDAEITKEDARALIFGGRLIKEVAILNGGILGTIKGKFQSLTPAEIKEIDGKLAKFLSEHKDKATDQGFKDERASLYLSYAWVETDGRSLGTTPEERLETQSAMAVTLLSAASVAWNALDLLTRMTINEAEFLKK